MITLDAIVLAGGMGQRFSATEPKQASLPKQFQPLGDVPVFIHATKALLTLKCVRQLLIAVPTPNVALAEEMVKTYLRQLSKIPIHVIEGGAERQDSARLALETIERISNPLPTRVLIHDACRPFLSRPFLSRLKERAFDRSYGAWIPVVPVTDTLKKVDNQQVLETLDRQTIQRSQTPQIFEYAIIRSLAERAQELDTLFTDDASMCEYFGIPVGTFDGDVHNMKLTYQFELDTLQSFLLGRDLTEQPGASPCASESDTTFTA